MSSTAVTTAARPGRRCVLCSHPDRAKIEFDLTSGSSSIRGVAGRYGLAAESVRRHVHNHLSAAARAALAGVDGAPGVTLAGRLIDIADHARDARAAAEAVSNTKLALAAGQAEARVLAGLVPLDSLGEDIAEEISDAADALAVIATTVKTHPEVADVIVTVLEARGRADWAQRIRQLAEASNLEIGDSANEH